MTVTSAQALRQRLSSLTRLHLLGPMPGPLPTSWDAPVGLVDGGGKRYAGGAPHAFWVGDGDSLAPELPNLEIPCLDLPPAKDVSDLRAVLDLLPESCAELELWGFLGGRKDHELANLGEIHRFLKARPQSRAQFDGPQGPVWGRGPGRWEFEIKGRYSFLALESCQVRMFGDCQFPIDPPRMVPMCSSLGISNQGHGTVQVHTGGAFFIFT